MPISKRTVNQSHTSRHSSYGILGCLLASCALAPAAFAAESLGAHEHGQARLQMAMENNQIELMFTSPAYNLAGFEYEARTKEEKKVLADINHWLETTPLINTDSGACIVASVTVELGGDEQSHSGHDQHKDGHHHDKHHHDHHGDKHGDHQDGGETHRDYEVAQQLTCKGLSGSDTFTSPLPARFPELEELAIEWVGPNGQGSTVMTPESRTFRLNHSS